MYMSYTTHMTILTVLTWGISGSYVTVMKVSNRAMMEDDATTLAFTKSAKKRTFGRNDHSIHVHTQCVCNILHVHVHVHVCTNAQLHVYMYVQLYIVVHVYAYLEPI